MKKLKKIFFVLGCLTSACLAIIVGSVILGPREFQGCKFPAHRSIAQAQKLEGIYSISGKSTEKGNYVGSGWVHKGLVQRVIQWKDYTYQKKEIESIWTGKVTATTFDFSLSLSNVLTRFEDYDATKEEIIPVTISLPIDSLQKEFSFSVNGDGAMKEVWTRLSDSSDEPLWTDKRQEIVGNGDKHPIIAALSKFAGVYKVIEMYRELPEIKQYENHAVFKSADQIWIQDKTDADFYLKHPDTLRITNKTINPLSLAEAMMRRNAYGHALGWKAGYFDIETAKYNLNSAGMLEVAVLDETGTKINGSPEGDSALWTAMYGWSQVVRYQLTKDPEAMANFKKVLNGTLTLLEIPGNTKEFARSLAVSPAEENLGSNWVQGTGNFAHLKWLKGGNNDMSKGLFITLSLAHQMVGSDETELIQRIQRAAKIVSEPTTIQERGFNYGIAKGLDALWNKNQDSLNIYHKKLLNFESFISEFTHLDAGIYIGGIADWSGIHLTMTSIMSQLFVSQELQKVFPDDSKNKKIHAHAEDSLMEIDKVYKNAHRGFLTLVAYAYSNKAHSDPEYAKKAQEALWSLKEVPAPRFVGNAGADLSKRSDWSVSAWPRQPWKALKGFRKLKDDPNVLSLIQGAYAYPYFEGTAWQTTYFWKDIPFPVTLNSNKATKSFSSDYLMLYWVSRSSGLISALD